MRVVRREDGQALIETAFSLALLFVMVLGAVEFGRLTAAAIEVDDAAHAAAQYGAQSPAKASDVSGMQTAAQNEYHTPASLTLVSPTSASGVACTCANTGAATSCTNNSVSSPSCPGSFREFTITVQTQVTYVPSIHLPGVAGSFVLKGNAVQKVLQ